MALYLRDLVSLLDNESQNGYCTLLHTAFIDTGRFNCKRVVNIGGPSIGPLGPCGASDVGFGSLVSVRYAMDVSLTVDILDRSTLSNALDEEKIENSRKGAGIKIKFLTLA